MKRAHATGPLEPAKRVRASLAVAPGAPIPASLSLDDAISSRRAEILALHRAMKSAREAGNTRAWQLLPRHLRRRAASHNILRLPAYLRGKAKAELKASNTLAKTRSEMRRRMPERTLRGFVRRRVDLVNRASRRSKRWLETHLWHAKRFRMTADKSRSDGGPGKWGFCLAETPHLKSHRASWRAANKGTTIHDASYTSVFAIRAKHSSISTRRLQLFLYLAGALHGWEDEWVTGERMCRTVLVERPRDPPQAVLGVMVPIAVLWLPRSEIRVFVHPAGTRQVQLALEQALAALRRAPTHPPVIAQDLSTKVAIRVRKVDMAPQVSIAAGLTGSAKRQSKQQSDVPGVAGGGVVDGFNIFDMIGPDAPRVLGGVLLNASGPNVAVFNRAVFQNTPVLSQDLPRGLVLSVEVDDPRVSFPPKNRPAAASDAKADTAVVAARTFFDYASLPKLAQGQITKHSPAERVPILLVQKSIGGLHGYTLFVPRGWGQAFWLSLVHSGAKVLGQAQVRQQMLNAQVAAFPYDWVGCAAHLDYADAAAAEQATKWARRPPAKRVNHAALGRAHPFGGRDMWATICGAKPRLALPSSELANVQVGAAPASSVSPASPASPWSRALYTGGIYTQPGASGDTLVPVLLSASRKGAFHECATVHLPLAADVDAWRAALDPPTREKDEAARRLVRLESSGKAGPPVGAVTTGDYALATGSGRAIAGSGGEIRL
ncbi:ribonuclease P [Malassezia cuniculi]|uniref:Ribonuclease P n=1 Tax=Malassezia cuniculi TaxID=948313 RepID=A0AAF0J5H8_9BASI|nr:ribonuclease P [Malassezia cuniculi]